MVPAAAAPALRFAKASRDELAEGLAALLRLPAGWTRIRAGSEAFLGTRYRFSPLGEGSGVDADPRLRWDAVDCLTLIETALALGEAPDVGAVEAILDDIRYASGKEPSFEDRLHLMEAQWIPDLIRKGYLEEATARLGGGATITASIRYDPAIWARRTNLRNHPWRDGLAGLHELPVIPLAAAIELGPTLPEGLVLNVVRVPTPGKMNLVTHSGLVVIRDGKRYVRHAALAEREVIDEPIERFLGRHARMRQRQVLGINLLAIRDNSARTAQIAASRSKLITGR